MVAYAGSTEHIEKTLFNFSLEGLQKAEPMKRDSLFNTKRYRELTQSTQGGGRLEQKLLDLEQRLATNLESEINARDWNNSVFKDPDAENAAILLYLQSKLDKVQFVNNYIIIQLYREFQCGGGFDAIPCESIDVADLKSPTNRHHLLKVKTCVADKLKNESKQCRPLAFQRLIEDVNVPHFDCIVIKGVKFSEDGFTLGDELTELAEERLRLLKTLCSNPIGMILYHSQASTIFIPTFESIVSLLKYEDHPISMSPVLGSYPPHEEKALRKKSLHPIVLSNCKIINNQGEMLGISGSGVPMSLFSMLSFSALHRIPFDWRLALLEIDSAMERMHEVLKNDNATEPYTIDSLVETFKGAIPLLGSVEANEEFDHVCDLNFFDPSANLELLAFYLQPENRSFLYQFFPINHENELVPLVSKGLCLDMKDINDLYSFMFISVYLSMNSPKSLPFLYLLLQAEDAPNSSPSIFSVQKSYLEKLIKESESQPKSYA
ncbi:hypothetical protein D5018_00615 [Parashewanella curva]|uniref:Uncharacterized protein n=1 Tax=Parashewanella curva TaxID=2338552 RepID=A0A3L8Q242_9GAMM|nr:hypothetical protein [Parashewanella curva]RLV61654.1 hypothetical protein D5018_00615 [Parashewanella curva]